MKPHTAPVKTPAMIAREEGDRGGQVLQDQQRDRRAERAEDELALDADVEHARPERDCDGEAGEDQRRRCDQRLGERPDRRRDLPRRPTLEGGGDASRVAERADEHRLVGRDDPAGRRSDGPDRVGAQPLEVLEVRDQDEDRADDEGGDDRERPGRPRVARIRRSAVHCAPPINMPTASKVAASPSRMPTIWPRVHDGDAVADGDDLLELGAHDEDGGPSVALLDDPLVDVLDRADVEPTRRLRRDDELHRPRELARDDDLLLVAARQRASVACGSTACGCRSRGRRPSRLRGSPRGRAGRPCCTARGGRCRGCSSRTRSCS